jgi:hypothetical protein
MTIRFPLFMIYGVWVLSSVHMKASNTISLLLRNEMKYNSMKLCHHHGIHLVMISVRNRIWNLHHGESSHDEANITARFSNLFHASVGNILVQLLVKDGTVIWIMWPLSHKSGGTGHLPNLTHCPSHNPAGRHRFSHPISCRSPTIRVTTSRRRMGFYPSLHTLADTM